MTIVRHPLPEPSFATHDFPVHPEDEASIIALYRDGLGDEQIARKMMFKLPVLLRILRALERDGKIRRRAAARSAAEVTVYKPRILPLTPEREAEFIRLYTGGARLDDIATALAMPRGTVTAHLALLRIAGKVERRKPLSTQPPGGRRAVYVTAEPRKSKTDWEVRA